MKRFILTLIGAIALIVSCEKKEQEVSVSSVSMNQAAVEMIIGETVQLSASVQPSNATEKTISWATSNQSVATVADGKVTALAEGFSTITASCGGKSATCQVTVSKGYVAVSSVTLSNSSLELVEGEEATLNATVEPSDATDKNVAWSTSDASVATVDGGKVTAVKAGTATVTAKAGDKTATCSIIVKQKLVPVESVELNESSVEIVEGGTLKLIASVKPENATDKNVAWKSSEVETVSVSSEGILTAIKPGNATVTVTTSDGNFTATCSVTVLYKPTATALFLNGGDWLYAANIGEHYSLSVTTEPKDCHLDLEWTLSDESIATISGEGTSIDLYTTDYGKTVLTVKDRHSGLSLSESVETRVKDFYWTENTGLQHDGIPMVEIKVGEEYQLHCNYSPEYATRIFRKDMAGFSYNGFVNTSPKYFTIDDNGLIKGVSSGLTLIESRIPVYKREGSSPLYVNVISSVESIELSKSSIKLNVGESETLIATIKPDDATDKTVTWKSSNTGVATVEDGVIKGVGIGTATITATVGDKSATCSVTVVKDSADGVSARFYGGSYVTINGLIQSGSKLNFGVVNYSSETINVVSVQLIDGETGSAGNVMPIGTDIESGSSSAWTITIGAAGIHSPTARFVYTFKGESYTCEAKFTSW